MQTMKKLRVFISSPGDVRQERLIAKKVIAELNQIYGNYIEIESVMWEDLPLEATSSFQQGIDYFLDEAPIDIAIFILWSRLGSTLGQSYLKRDGSLYRSGTEYEYDTMYALWEKTGHPRIMVYVKDAEPQFGQGLSRKEIKECLTQHEQLNDFIEEKFRDRETGTNYAYWQFDKQSTFEERLKTHLSRLVREHIGADVIIKEWEGNPYIGLRSFGINESLVFCGRKELAYDVLSRLVPSTDDSAVESLLVLGESGSGKSSFIMAGLLPLIYSNDKEQMRKKVYVCRPSDFHGMVYAGLYGLLYDMYPSLAGNPALEKLRDGVPANYDYQFLQFALKNIADQSPVLTLVVDQFEELFSDSSINEDERLRSLALLNILVQTRQMRIIITMRNDFYGKFAAYQSLGAIKNNSVVVDIPNASVSSLSDIIEEPARKASIQWEINDQGVALNKVVIRDAVKVNSLPLIEFALSELYKECADAGKMTYAAYNKIGRIGGAVARYADGFYESLTDSEKNIFRELLSCVVTVSHDDECRYVRKTSLRGVIEKTPEHKAVLDKLVSAHLFTSGKDIHGAATFTIAHEVLITSWSVVRDWIESEAEFIEKYDYYERQAKHWDGNGRQKKDLIYERSVLLEAEYFMFRHRNKLQSPTFDYLDRSLIANRRKGLVKYIFGFVSVLLIMVCGAWAVLRQTTGDKDMDDTFGFNGVTIEQYLTLFIPLLIVVGNAVYLRLFPNYRYRTIRSSAVIWGLTLLFIMAVVIYEKITDSAGLVWNIVTYLPFFLCAGSVFFDYYRRHLWNRSIFRTYLFTDKYEKVKDIVVASVIGLFVLAALVLYGVVITEKNERYEKTLEITDELFNGLNNIKDQLSWSDNLYVNNRRMDYLLERFQDQLFDTIPDDREFEYAQCLYNIREPYRALAFLYPDHTWRDHLMFILCAMESGRYETAEIALDAYVDGKRYDDLNWASTKDLIWVAEKLGRFDLAENIYHVMDSVGEDWGQHPAAILNYGHIELMKGDPDLAKRYYGAACEAFKQMSGTDDCGIMLKSLEQDLQTFKWLGVGDSAAVRSMTLELGMPERTFYTAPGKDSDAVTAETLSRLAGTWMNQDSTVTMSYREDPPLCQYRVVNAGNEVNRILTNLRCSRQGSCLFMEEFNQSSNDQAISSGEIVRVTDDSLELLVIENGVAADRGAVRKFTRVADE